MAKSRESAPALRDGDRLGGYRIVRIVGRGGMADVYKALTPELVGFVAVKAIRTSLGDDPMYTEMFLEEGRVGLMLEHPNLIRTREVKPGPPLPYIVMDYISGIDLSRILRYSQKFGERLSFSEASYIAHGIASALAYAHELRDEQGRPLGLVNRDVSPQNVRLAIDGSVKLFDFGIARNATRFSPEIGFVKGKHRYMSPEQIRGLPLDARSDIFSFGIVLHELLVGRPLFADQNQFQIADAISSARIAPPSKTVPRTPPELDEICMSCLKRRPEDRIDSLTQVLPTLTTFAGELDACRKQLSSYLDTTFPTELAEEREENRVVLERAGVRPAEPRPVPARETPVAEATDAQTRFVRSTSSASLPTAHQPAEDVPPPPMPVAVSRVRTLWLVLAVVGAGIAAFLGVWLLTQGG